MTFPRVTVDAVNRAAQVLETASGKSINVALTLRMLGESPLAIGFLGGDSGRFVRQDLDRAGVAHDFVEIETKTRTCTTVLDHSTGTATELVEETRPVEPSGSYNDLLARVGQYVPKATALCLSGSLPPKAPQDFYARCARVAREHSVPVLLDGRGEPLRLALAEGLSVVKPNRLELQETVGVPIEGDASLRRAVAQLFAHGLRWAVITDGPRDAIASDGEHFWRVTPPKIEAVNPIGSGDAFAAGLTIALVRGDDLPTACRLGAACGAANALNSPAGHARGEDVRRLLEMVRVEKM